MKQIKLLFVLFIVVQATSARGAKDSLLTIDRFYSSSEFNAERQRPEFWINEGDG